MTNQHPLTDELVKSWIHAANHNEPMFPQVACFAADWQLAQCLQYVLINFGANEMPAFMEAMRPTEDQRSMQK